MEDGAMADTFKHSYTGKMSCLMDRKGAGSATEAAWITLGGCNKQITAVRLQLILKARETLK